MNTTRFFRLAAVACVCVLFATHNSAAEPADAAACLSPEAQKALDVGLGLSEEAFVSGKPEEWDAAIDALMKAHELAPAHSPIMLRLAAAHQQRKRFLAATAWGNAYLYAAPKGEFAKNAREIVEYCSRQAEAQKIKIFAAARELAGKVPRGGNGEPDNLFTSSLMPMMPGDRWEWYHWQRAQSGKHPMNFSTCDHRKGVLEDVRAVQAAAGDFAAFADEAAVLVADLPDDFTRMPWHRGESPCWNALFATCLETKDWPGALAALGWDCAALDVADDRREKLQHFARVEQAWFHGEAEQRWRDFSATFVSKENCFSNRPALVETWTRLAAQLADQERDAGVEQRVGELQQQAAGREGNAEQIPVRLAELGVPLGKALRTIHALERSSQSVAIEDALGMNAAGADAVKAALAGNPQIVRGRGCWDATALHVAALGSEGTNRGFHYTFDRLPRLDITIEEEGRSFRLGTRATGPELLEGIPAAKRLMELLLASGADVHAKMTNGWTPLHVAAAGYSGNGQGTALVELLLAKGANASACDNRGVTPLHVAAAYANAEAIECLLAKGADASATTRGGRTPLHEACGGWAHQGERDRLFEPLLAHGADVNVHDRQGVTPLHLVAQSGDTAAVEYLLGKQADATASDARRQTPLHLAAAKGHSDVAKRLCDAGADAAAKSIDNKTAAELAAQNGHAELSEYLDNL